MSGGVAGLRNSIGTTSYEFAYGDDIDIYGLSLSKEVGGVSVGSDLNIRHNMPLASIPAIISAAGPGWVAGRVLACCRRVVRVPA